MSITLLPKVPVPAEIEGKMKFWRMGEASLPQAYIDWHRERAAESVVRDLKGYTIHNQFMVDDGWLDGMKFLCVIAEDRDGKLLKLKWCDSQQWFLHHPPSGGWSLFTPQSGT